MLTKSNTSKITSSDVLKHLRYFEDTIFRSESRIKQNGEHFTPTGLVKIVLDQIPEECFKDPNKTFLDPSCGDGQFLSEVLIKKMENGSSFEQAISTIYGVDIMQDNVEICRERLLCGQTHLRHIVERNIVCGDGLDYEYLFDKNQK